MDVFNKLRELLKSENRTLLRCGLELMSILGHLLDGVVDIELKSSADDSVSSDSMGEDIVKAGCFLFPLKNFSKLNSSN